MKARSHWWQLCDLKCVISWHSLPSSLNLPKYEHLNMKGCCGGLNRTTCSLQFSPRGRTPPWSHGLRPSWIWPRKGLVALRGFLYAWKHILIWYFAPYLSSGAYNPAGAGEGCWICQNGAQPLQEMKRKLIYFKHFGVWGGKGSRGHTGVGLLLGFAAFQD